MTASREPQTVVTRDGIRGVVATAQSAPDDQHLMIEFAEGEPVVVPVQLLTRQRDGSYLLDAAYRDLQRSVSGEPLVIPVVREEISIDREIVETGRVQVRKIVEEREETIEEPVVREDVAIERVAVNRLLTEPATVRTEGDVTIIPLMEEVIVIEKRLMLREEVHISRRRTRAMHQETVTVRTEDVRVGRVHPDKPSEKA